PKAIAATGLGLFLASIGFDPQSAVPRFTFGQLRLLDGMDFVVVTIGLFAISEVFLMLEQTDVAQGSVDKLGRVALRMRDLTATIWTMIRGSVIGFLVGVLPGAGGTVASFVAYTAEQRVVDREGTFGKGDARGVAAPEAANNAAANGAMIPLLTLGVPGSATTAVLLGALMGLNITPGPLLIERNPEVFWGLVASMYLGNVFLLVLNLPMVGVFVRILRLPRWVLMPAVVALSCVGVYAVNASVLDLALMTLLGAIGYLMRKTGFPLAPVILGLVLGPLMEKSLRRALALSGGELSVLFDSSIALVLWILAAVSLFSPLLLRRSLWRRA
ncbi:MAG: tripartite tricarboxylate transporter permease, partial [Gemmatimonadales bacterium]